MRKGKDNASVIFMGRYNESEILSGPEKTAKRIFGFRSKETESVFIQYFFDGRIFGIRKKLFGRKLQKLDNNSTLYTVGLLRLIPLLISLKPGLIHIITFERFAVLCFVYKIFSKVKIVYNSHGVIAYENQEIKNQPYFYKLKDRVCEKKFLKKSDLVVFPSEFARELAKKYFTITKNTVIVPNGIDEAFHDSFSSRKTSGSPVVRAVVMNINDFSASGIELLKKLLEYEKNAIDLSVIGSKLQLVNSDSVHKIRFYDRMDKNGLADFYKDKDLFFSLNRYETFSIATAEAMAAGLIPVANESAGISSYIKGNDCGLILKEDEIENSVKDLDKLIKNNSLRKEYSLRSSSIFETLNWNSVYLKYRNIY
jgi:glycosyltransferase involved in cell wall biosynthesis